MSAARPASRQSCLAGTDAKAVEPSRRGKSWHLSTKTTMVMPGRRCRSAGRDQADFQRLRIHPQGSISCWAARVQHFCRQRLQQHTSGRGLLCRLAPLRCTYNGRRQQSGWMRSGRPGCPSPVSPTLISESKFGSAAGKPGLNGSCQGYYEMKSADLNQTSSTNTLSMRRPSRNDLMSPHRPNAFPQFAGEFFFSEWLSQNNASGQKIGQDV